MPSASYQNYIDSDPTQHNPNIPDPTFNAPEFVAEHLNIFLRTGQRYVHFFYSRNTSDLAANIYSALRIL